MTEPSFLIDPQTLRDRPVDEAATRARLSELEAAGEEGEAECVPLLRMLGETARACEVGWRVLGRLGGPGDPEALERSGVIPIDSARAAIRLAHALHWNGDLDLADDLYSTVIRSLANAAMEDDPRVPELEAFAHQHLGKLRFEEGRYDIARFHFEHALGLREKIGAPADQIESTRQALARVEELRA